MPMWFSAGTVKAKNKDCAEETESQKSLGGTKQPKLADCDVQGLLGQCALATVAILGTLATLNL
jgi:hypothetical protein